MDIMNDPTHVAYLCQLFLKLLNHHRDVVFFNGICGNSLDHFHCQYTTSQFPIFNMDESFEGLYAQNGFLGYSIVCSDSQPFFAFLQRVQAAAGLTYNFIAHKVAKEKLQIIVFVRHCVVPAGVKDLNYGSTELAGVIVSGSKSNTTHQEFYDYINATHSIQNYLNIINSN